MKPETIKLRLDPLKYGVTIGISLLLLLTNLLPIRFTIAEYSDSALNPFLISIRSFGLNTDIFFNEVINKQAVLKENLELKKKNAELEAMIAEKDVLKADLQKLQNDKNIYLESSKSYKKLMVRGVQNVYASSPSVILEMNRLDEVSTMQAVYYTNGQLFGLVNNVNGLTATALPFYSRDLGFNVPVKSSKEPDQTGFISPIDNGVIKIKNVSRNASVSIGDIWITTNDREEIPGDLVVGKVKVVRENTETGFKELELEPPFVVRDLSYLLVTKPSDE